MLRMSTIVLACFTVAVVATVALGGRRARADTSPDDQFFRMGGAR
jgi:hypothetical protein